MPKPTCERTPQISVSKLRRRGAFRSHIRGFLSWSAGEGQTNEIGFVMDALCQSFLCECSIIQDDGSWREYSCKIALTRTPCHFGGFRRWFTCPACERRIGILYFKGGRLACRICHGLCYRSQQTTHVGATGAMIRFIQRDGELQRGYSRTRTRLWKQQPTKGYRRWLEKYRSRHLAACSVVDLWPSESSQLTF